MDPARAVCDSLQFWVLPQQGNKPLGPCSQDELEALLNQGRIGYDDLVYYQDDWRRFTDVFDVHPKRAFPQPCLEPTRLASDAPADPKKASGETPPEARTASPGGDPPRVAVIAIHGVGNQRPGQTAARIAGLLLKQSQAAVSPDCPLQRNCYPGFAGERIQIATRSIDLSPLGLSRREVAEVTGDVAGLEDLRLSRPDLLNPADLPPVLKRKLRSRRKREALRDALHEKARRMGCDSAWHTEVLQQLEQHASEGPSAAYETVCLQGTTDRGCERRDRPRGVDIYELHWADLSRLDEGALSILRAIYQVVFELAWLGNHTLEAAAESLRPPSRRGSAGPETPKPGRGSPPRRALTHALFNSLASVHALFSVFLTTVIPLQSVLALAMLALLYLSSGMDPSPGPPEPGNSATSYAPINAVLVFALLFTGLTAAALKLDATHRLGWSWKFWAGFLPAIGAAVVTFWMFAGEVPWIDPLVSRDLPGWLDQAPHWDRDAAALLLWLVLATLLAGFLLTAFGPRQRVLVAWTSCALLFFALTVLLVFGLTLRISAAAGQPETALPQPLAAVAFAMAGATWLLLALWSLLGVWMMLFAAGFVAARLLLFLKRWQPGESRATLRQLSDSLWTALISVTLPALVTLVINVALWHVFLVPLRDGPWPGPKRLLDEKLALPTAARDWVFHTPWLPALNGDSVLTQGTQLAVFMPWDLPGFRDLQTQGEPGQTGTPMTFSRVVDELLRRVIPPSVEAAFFFTLIGVVFSAWCFLPAILCDCGRTPPARDLPRFSRLLGQQVARGFLGLRWSQVTLTAGLLMVTAGFAVAPRLSRLEESIGPRWTDRFFLGIHSYSPDIGFSPGPLSAPGSPASGDRGHPVLRKLDLVLNGGTWETRRRRYVEADQASRMIHGVIIVAYCLIAVVLVGGYTPLGRFAHPLVEGFRMGTGAVLDIVNYLRRRPMKQTIRARVLSRFVSLLRYVATRPDPVAPDRPRYSRIVIVAHSQGTVIAVDALKLLQPEAIAKANGFDPQQMPPIRLFTMGSPLRQLYGLRLPQTFDWARSPETDGGGMDLRAFLNVEAWWNAYRSGDYIGRYLWRTGQDLDDAFVPGSTHPSDPGGLPPKLEFCLTPGAHTRYWKEQSPEILDGLDRLIRSDDCPKAEPVEASAPTSRPQPAHGRPAGRPRPVAGCASPR